MEWWQQLNAGMPAGQPRPGSVEALNMAMQAQQSQRPKQQGLDPRAWISEIAGTLGTIGGGIVGGPVGAGIGGAGGSALGQVLEQKIKGEPINPSKFATETVLSGAFGYGPLRALGKVTGLSASKGLQALGAKGMSNAQRNLLKNTLGVFTAAKAGGRELSEAQSNKLVDYMIGKNLVKSGSSSREIATALSRELAKSGREIGTLIRQATPTNMSISVQKEMLRRNLMSAFDDVTMDNWKKNVFANNIMKKVNAAKSPEDLWKVLQISRVPKNMLGSPDVTASAIRQYSDKTYRAISSTLKELVPGYSGLASDYTTGKQLWDFIGATARKAGGMSQFNRIPLPSRALERSATAVAMAGTPQAGRPSATQAAYNALNPAYRQGVGIKGTAALGPRGVMGLANTGRGDAARRMIGANIVKQFTPSAPGEMPEEMAMSAAGQPFGGMQGIDMGMGMQQQVESPYPYENLMYDMQRDPQNADKYVDYYNQISQLFAGPKLNSTQQQRKGAADNALRDIPMIIDAIQTGKLGLQQAIPGSQTGPGQRILGTGNIQGAMFNIMDNILRARTGAAMPESEVRRYMLYLMPTPWETKETQMAKLERLVRELQAYSNPTTAMPSTLEDVLMQQGGM